MKHVYSQFRQKGIHAVKSGKERVIIDDIWSLEVPAGYSYCAEYEKTATDINGNHYRLQVQKSDSCDFSTSYGSEVNLTVRDEVVVFNNYTSDARDAKEALMQFASAIGIVNIIKEEKNILTAICESIFVPGNYSFYVITGGRNVMYHGQITFADDTGLDEAEIAKSFIRSIEAVLIKDLAAGDGLVRLPDSYIPNFDTGKYLEVDSSFRVPIPEGYETKYDLNSQIKAAVIPKDSVFTSTGVRCKVGFVMYQDPINAGASDTRKVIDVLKQYFLDQTGIDFYHWPITTVRDTSKGTIVYSTITNTPCDQNTNPFLVVTGGKAYHCFIVITYDGPISDECDTKWDANIITTAWLSRILFKGEKKPDKAQGNEDMFEKAFPDKTLYPHYDHLMNAAPKIPGTVVVVNQNGTEYAFYGLGKASDSDNDDFGDDQKALFSRIVALDTESYDLDQAAQRMAAVFHVDQSVFDMRNDREAELLNGYMKHAYMFSALRSFGWTLSDYCSKKKKLPQDVSVKELKAIVEFISKRNWLNYNDKTYCKGLCLGSDLHVYYVPDNITQDDKSKLLPSQEDNDRVSKMQSIAPAYNEILSSVESLDALRGSLKFIYPAVKTLHDELAKKRNYKKPLEGNEADIVYAWCALAMAAKEPFFTEDGPMNYFLSQPKHGDMPVKAGKFDGKISKDEASKRDFSSKGGSWSFPTADTSKINTKLLENDKGIAARVLSIAEVNKEEDIQQIERAFREHMTAFNPEFHEKMETILPLADKYSSLFIDANGDNLLGEGILVNTAPIHSLRSFVWTATNINKNKASVKFPVDAPKEMWRELARFLQSKGCVNYKQCDPESKIYGRALFRAKEVGLIYTFDGYASFKHDESLVKSIKNAVRDDLFELVSILHEIIPVMEFYYNQITDSNDAETEGVEAMKGILQGWTAFAYACRTPFCVVQKNSYKGDSNGKNKPAWTEKCETKEYEGGKFIAIGTSLIEVNDHNEILRIPEGITDINLGKVYTKHWNPTSAKKVIFPASFTGRVVIPSNAEEIEILGDFDKLGMIAYEPNAPLPKLKRIVCKGMANSLEYSFVFTIRDATNLKEIVFPEGLIEITDINLTQNNIETVRLPESLERIEETSIDYPDGLMGDYPVTTFVVYRTCAVLDLLKRQLKAEEKEIREWNDIFKNSPDKQKQHSYKIKEVDNPWISSAMTFASQIPKLYEKKSTEGVESDVERIIKSAFESGRDFRFSKECITKEAKKAGLNSFAEIIKNTNDIDVLPEVLAEDIKNTIETRIQKEKEKEREEEEKRREEIIKLSQSERLPDLDRAIRLLKTYYSESSEAEELVKRCIDKISSIKADKYTQASNLAEEGTEDSISTAISLLREISPFDDSKNRIMVYQKKLEDEKAYNRAVSMMSGTDIANLIAVREAFEGLGEYKDSAIKAAACEKYLNDLCEKKYQEAKDTQAVYTVDSQTLAMAAYSELGEYKDALERIAICTSNITAIQEILELEEQIERHNEDLKSLTGFFKRRQRQEKEELIKNLEQQISELKTGLQ